MTRARRARGVSTRWRYAAVVVALGVGVAVAAFTQLPRADAQRLDPRRPAVFIVGSPGGASPTVRVDARRTGVAKEPLPSGTLRVAWRRSVGLGVEQPALVGPDGMLALVTVRGDVVFLDSEGEERGRVTSGVRSVAPATITSDGTVVFTSSLGEAVGVRRTTLRPRYVTRIGGDRTVRAAPLSLDDGGVVVATGSELVVLDAEGNVRSRVSLPESPSAPLLAAGDKIVAITSTGAVYGWAPGREPFRLGSFGAPIDGGAALADATTLVAVIEGNHLVELDLAHGTRTSRAIAPQGLYLGPPSVRSVQGAGNLATLLALTPTRAFVVTLDASGQETARAPIATLTPSALPDGGPMPLVAPPHTGPLVDARGAIAFAAPDGHVGVASPDGAVDTIGELICASSARSAGVAGLTPAGNGAFVLTCENGVVAKIVGAGAEAPRRPSPIAPPSRP